MKLQLTFMTGFRPIISARQERMLGSRNPLDGPTFDTLQDAITFTIGILTDLFDHGLELSDGDCHFV